MKTPTKLCLCFSIIGLLFSIHLPDLNGQTSDDTLKIMSASLDYIEGWYEGNPKRIKQSLHKKLAKRQIHQDPVSGKTRITNMNGWQLALIANLSGGRNLTPENDRNISVQILDISGNAASVKVESADFTDFLHLARKKEGWVIVNILWEPKLADQEGIGFSSFLILILILCLIISPFLLWPAEWFIRQHLRKELSGIHRYCADRKLVSKINLLLAILFTCLFFLLGGWILYILCMLCIPNLVWSTWIMWRQKFWRVPGRIYYSMVSLLILMVDLIILFQFNII